VFVPATAIGANVRLWANGALMAGVGPTGVLTNFYQQALAMNTTSTLSMTGHMEFDQNYLFFCGSAGTGFDIIGWTDQVNAN
jgi:hypothetical protein